MTDEELIAGLRGLVWSGTIPRTAAARIEALKTEVARLKAGWQDANEAALTNAYDLYAAEAAAYEAAAQAVENDADEFDYPSTHYTFGRLATAIRALATPDQTAALDRVRAEAKAEGMRSAAKIALHHREEWISAGGFEGFATGAKLIRDAILAAIPKEGV